MWGDVQWQHSQVKAQGVRPQPALVGGGVTERSLSCRVLLTAATGWGHRCGHEVFYGGERWLTWHET